MIVRELSTLLNFKVDERGLRQFDQGLNQAAQRANHIAVGIRQMAAGVAVSLAGAFGVSEIIRAGDAYTTAMNRIRAAVGSENADTAFEGLYASARETGIAVDETSKSFMRFQPAMAKAGFGIADTIALVDGLQKGLLAAGAGTAETASVFTQLGQAINSGVLQGEELNALLENASPTIVQAFADTLGIAREELKEMASQGKLVAKNVLPALLKAAIAGRKEFEAMKTPVQQAMETTRVAVDRLTSDFSEAFKLTEKLANLIKRVGNRIDEWRRYIPTIRDAVNEFGGLEQILASLAWGIGAASLALVVFNGALATALVRAALFAAPFLAASAAVVLLGASLQDFYKWVTGADVETQFGTWFGPFKDLVKPFEGAFTDIKTLFTGAPDEIMAAWNRLKAYFRAWAGEAFANFPPAVKKLLSIEGEGAQAARPPQDLDAYRAAAGSLAQERIGTPVMGWLSNLLGAIGFNRQVQQPDGTMRALRAGESMTDAMNSVALRRMAPGSVTTNAPITQTNTNHVTINATGVSGAEVAAGATRGVDRAVRDNLLGLESLARQMRMSMPGVEGAGGPVGVTP